MKKEKNGVSPNAVIYSAVIAACGNARQVDLAVSLLREMTPSNGIPPDVVSYNSAIAACATSKQWQQAVEEKFTKFSGEPRDASKIRRI